MDLQKFTKPVSVVAKKERFQLVVTLNSDEDRGAYFRIKDTLPSGMSDAEVLRVIIKAVAAEITPKETI